jgi:hypothetical protein
MKIKFYQLPKEERKRILHIIEKYTQDRDTWKENLDLAQQRLDTAKFNFEVKEHCLRSLKDKYDFE